MLVRHPLVDEILDANADRARGQDAAFAGYRNHAHRIVNFSRGRLPRSARRARGGGIPREVRRAADAEYPADAFLRRAVPRAALAWIRHHPLRPAPPFRGEAALRRTGRA